MDADRHRMVLQSGRADCIALMTLMVDDGDLDAARYLADLTHHQLLCVSAVLLAWLIASWEDITDDREQMRAALRDHGLSTARLRLEGGP